MKRGGGKGSAPRFSTGLSWFKYLILCLLGMSTSLGLVAQHSFCGNDLYVPLRLQNLPPTDTNLTYPDKRCYSDRWGNIVYSDQLVNDTLGTYGRVAQGESCQAGHFLLRFDDDGTQTGFYDPVSGETRRLIACQVFADLSNLIMAPVGSCNDLVVIDFFRLTNPNDRLGTGSGKYQLLQGYGSGAVIHGEAWKTLNTGVSNMLPNENHGEIDINFEPNIEWNVDLTITSLPPAIIGLVHADLYQVILHEALHVLEMTSLMTETGNPTVFAGSTFNVEAYSNWDRFIEKSNTPLRALFQNSSYSLHWVFSILPADLVSGFQNLRFRDVGLDLPLYSPPAFRPGSSLSHFDSDGWVTQPYFVMQPSFDPSTLIRCPQQGEVSALCALGFQTSGVYGDGTLPFHRNDLPACGTIIAGVNDGLEQRVFLNSPCFSPITARECNTLSLSFADLLQNDQGATSILPGSIQLMSGNVSSFTVLNNSLEIIPNGVGRCVFSYIPVDNQAQQGNITLIFITVLPCSGPICDNLHPCNLISNPNFEYNGTYTQLPLTIAHELRNYPGFNCWYIMNSTPDYYPSQYFPQWNLPNNPGGSIGLGTYDCNNIICNGEAEIVFTPIQLDINQNFILSFFSKSNSVFPGVTNGVYVGLIPYNDILFDPIDASPVLPPVNWPNIQMVYSHDQPVSQTTWTRNISCFSQLNSGANTLLIYQTKSNSNDGVRSYSLFDAFELIEDHFSAGPDMSVNQCGVPILIGTDFCSISGTQYEWFDLSDPNNPVSLGVSGSTTTTVTPSQTTTYRLVRTLPTGQPGVSSPVCNQAIDEMTVFVNPPAGIDASFTVNAQACPSYSFVPAVSSGTHHWNFGDGSSSNAANPTHTYLSGGVFTVTHTLNFNGCSYSESLPLFAPANCCGAGITKVVGSASPTGIDNLDDAIVAGLLLNHQDSWDTYQDVVILGDFYFNSGSPDGPYYTFLAGSEIVMGTGAEIFIDVENHLVLDDALVHGCGEYWRAIHVLHGGGLTTKHSKVDGGEYGVLLEPGAEINCHTTDFTKCYSGIHADFLAMGNVKHSPVIGSTFRKYQPSNTALPTAYPGMDPGHLVPTFGIHLTRVNGFDIGDGVNLNEFHELSRGVQATEIGFLSVMGSSFTDMVQHGVYATGLFGGSSVRVDGNAPWGNQAGLVQFSHSAQVNSMVAVEVKSANMLVQGCIADNVNTGTLASFMDGCTVDINTNQLVARSRGIQVMDMLNPTGATFPWSEIRENDITLTSSTKPLAISVDNCHLPLNVLQNSVFIDQLNQGGIFVRNSPNTSLFLTANDIHLGLPGGLQPANHNNLPLYGIRVEFSDGISVECNHVIGNPAYPRALSNPSLESYYNGYVQVSSPTVQANCNEFDDLRVCMRYSGTNANTLIRGNYFDQQNQVGLWLSTTGNIGTQNNDAGNAWTGTFDPNKAAINSALFIGAGQLTVSASFATNPILLPPPLTAQSTSTNQYLVSQGPGNSGTYYYCPIDNTTCQMFTPQARQAVASLTGLDSLIAGTTLPYPEYMAEQNAWDDKLLYEKLKDNQDLDGDMLSFKQSVEQGSYDELSQIAASRHKLLGGNLQLANMLDQQRMVSIVLLDSLAAKKRALASAGSLADSLLAQAELESLGSSYSLLVTDLKALQEAYKQVVSQESAGLELQTIGAVIGDYQEAVLKQSLELYYATVAKGLLPDATQQATLEGIVYQCPVVAGPGIYLARTMYEHLVPEIYHDEETCRLQGVQMREAMPEAPATGIYQLYPNPNTGHFKLDVPLGQEVQAYRLLDARGMLAGAGRLNPGAGTQELNLSHLPSGFYYLELDKTKGGQERLKLLIQAP